MKPFAASKATVLVFCLDSDVLSALRGALEDAGYLVLPAESLDSAVNWLADTEPDLLIVSSYLDGISGDEAAVLLRNKYDGLRVLMLAGMPNDDRVANRESLSEIKIFPKLFALPEFLENVAAVLAERYAA